MCGDGFCKTDNDNEDDNHDDNVNGGVNLMMAKMIVNTIMILSNI